MKKKCVLVAGGTGGHINAALSMGEAFNDYEVQYLSGTRYLDYKLFKDKNAKHLDSKPLRTKNPIILVKNILSNLKVFMGILFFYIKEKPDFIIGAGGYICGPTLLAGKILRKPIFIIEQNAVMGMTNKILSRISDIIFTNFKNTKGLENHPKVKTLGNPIRGVIEGSKNILQNGEINILVFGGSLGATQINEVITNLLEKDFNGTKVNFLHQIGKGNENSVKIKYPNINYTQHEYLDDMKSAYEWSNIIISRAGASTISELRVVRRPSILIPYPAATDNHQFYNAIELENENLSYISVLDHKLDVSNLTEEVYKSLLDIIENSKFYQSEQTLDKASLKIKEEILKHVWNK